MCTLIVAFGLWPDAPLVVAANRDERLGRPAEPPQLRPGGAGGSIVAPRDVEQGGTWLGLNGAGVFAAITNRFGPRHLGRRSRGALIVEALEEPSAEAGLARVAAQDGSGYNGFHLVVADRRGAGLLVGDGARLEVQPLPPGVHVVTERSFGAGETKRPALVAARMTELTAAGGPPSEGALAALLRVHGPEPLESVCVHAPTLDYGTRSSTLLRVDGDGAARFLHAEGPPCENAYRDFSALAAEARDTWAR